MTGRRKPFPGVTKVTDRHGKVRWRFRRAGRADCYIPRPYGSAAFRTAYEAALAGAALPVAYSPWGHGSLGWLIETYLASPRFKNLSEIRKTKLRNDLDWLRREAGDLPFTGFGVQHVEALMAKKKRPGAANAIKKLLSQLFNFAIRSELCGQKHNPARLADRMKTSPDGWHTWTREEIAQFLAFHGEGTKARLAALLVLNTGAARGDLIGLGWQNVRDGWISYRRHKTGVAADMPILAALAAEINHVPRDQMLFLTHGAGRRYSRVGFGKWFKAQCVAAGLPHCSAHGLRKGQATAIADAGGSENQIMAYLAHATPREGATYTKKADRKRLTTGAFDLLAGTKTEQNLSNLPDGLDKSTTQHAEKK